MSANAMFILRYIFFYAVLMNLLVTLIFILPCLSLTQYDKQLHEDDSVNFDVTSLLYSPLYGNDSLSFKFATESHSRLFFTKLFLQIPGSPNLVAYTKDDPTNNDENLILVSFRLRSDVSKETLDLILNYANVSFDTLSEISSGITFHFDQSPDTFRIFRLVEIRNLFTGKEKANQVGIAYTKLEMDTRIEQHENLVGLSDICQLKIEYSKERFPWSYDSFRDEMLPIVEKNEKFVHTTKRGCVIYYQLRLVKNDAPVFSFLQWPFRRYIIEGSRFQSRQDRRMYLLFVAFALTFAKEINIRIILDSFYSADNFVTGMTEKNLNLCHYHELDKNNNGLIIPIIETSHYQPFHFRHFDYDRFLIDNYQLAKQRFTDLYIRGYLPWSFRTTGESFYVGLTRPPSHDCPWAIGVANSGHPIKIHLGLSVNLFKLMLEAPESLQKLLNDTTKEGKNYSPNSVTIEEVWDANYDESRTPIMHLINKTETIEFIQNNNMRVRFSCGITVNLNDTQNILRANVFAGETRQYCGIFESGDGTTVELNLLIDKINSINFFNTHFLKILEPTLETNGLLRQLKISLASFTVKDVEKTSMKSSFYCTPARNFRNEFSAALINFSKVTKIPVKLQPVVGGEWDVNYFDHLRIRSELQNVSENCPVFVSRNRFVQTFDKTWTPDPCLYRTEKVPDTGINFNLNTTGITFNLTNQSKSLQFDLGQEELKIMMIFAFHKFNKIETILPGGAYGISKLEYLTKILTSMELHELIELNNISNKSLYWDVDLNALLLKRNLETLNKVVKTINRISFVSKFAVHFSDWETSERYLVQAERLINLCNGSQNNFNCGLTINNCALEINNAFSRLTDFFNDMQLRITYIVCVEDAVVASNDDLDTFQEYLDSHLYMIIMFQRAFPGISVYFRLKSIPDPNHFQEAQLDRFLRFNNDVNQFASLNHVKYFLLQAVQTEEFSGWWQVEKRLNNGSTEYDYANITAYVELESKFLGRDTWKPKFPEESFTSQYSIATIIEIISAVSVLLIIGGLIILALYLRKKLKLAKRLLSKDEVENFFDGVADELGNEMELLPVGDRDAAYMRIKYNQNFEIPLENILFENILLGSGNFGVVRKASIAATTVAVKIAREECTAEAFKSLLMEVKIMSYVGNHENVVEFKGACTKAIRNGVIYIVMEMCENGSLEGYLREKLSVDKAKDKLYDLHRFSQEIASGMEFIASKRIVHGDLSTRNVLLDSHLTCKVADFGLSRKLDANGEYIKNTEGALPWRSMAIESLKDKKFTTQSDIWSFGVTAWEIYSLGKVPYTGMEWSSEFVQSLDDGMRLTCPQSASAELHDAMMRCWSTSPASRPSFSDLVTFFRQIRITTDYSVL